MCFSVWPDEDDNLVLEKLTRRVEHLMGILAASNKYHSDNFMVINLSSKCFYTILNISRHRSRIRMDPLIQTLCVQHSIQCKMNILLYILF